MYWGHEMMGWGGGFFMIYAPGRHVELNSFMAGAGRRRMQYGLEFEGSKIVSNSASHSGAMLGHEAIVADA